MARRPLKKKHTIKPDHKFGSVKVEKLINYVMWDGKKSTARTVVYDCFDQVSEKMNSENPLEVFERAIKNVGPTMEIRSRRIGSANYTVPREVRPERRLMLAMRWIIEVARSRKGKPMAQKLADEIVAASNNEGDAVAKRVNTHKMAEANKAFAHFAW